MGDCLGDWRTTFSSKIIQIKRCPEIETENWNGNEEGEIRKSDSGGEDVERILSVQGSDGLLMECNYTLLLKSQAIGKVHASPDVLETL